MSLDFWSIYPCLTTKIQCFNQDQNFNTKTIRLKKAKMVEGIPKDIVQFFKASMKTEEFNFQSNEKRK